MLCTLLSPFSSFISKCLAHLPTSIFGKICSFSLNAWLFLIKGDSVSERWIFLAAPLLAFLLLFFSFCLVSWKKLKYMGHIWYPLCFSCAVLSLPSFAHWPLGHPCLPLIIPQACEPPSGRRRGGRTTPDDPSVPLLLLLQQFGGKLDSTHKV